MPPDIASSVVNIVFQTLYIYDDRASIRSVDDIVIKGLSDANFMKNFASTLALSIEKQLKTRSIVGCYRLLKWSCLLLRWSQFTSVSKSGFSRIAGLQISLLSILMQGSFRVRRACKQLFIHLFAVVLVNNFFLNYLVLCLL